MSVDDLLRRCGEAGVAVWNDGGRLRYRVLDGSGLPADLAAELRADKADLLANLAGRPEPRPGGCWTCAEPVLGWPDALYANCAVCAQVGARRVLARLRGTEGTSGPGPETATGSERQGQHKTLTTLDTKMS